MPATKPSDLPDWLIAHGRHFVTSDEVSELVGVDPSSVRQSLRRPLAANKIVSITNGAWAPVAPEHRRAGAPPPAHYIDQLMGFLGHPYYVGFLSAAAIQGASHQAATVFQLATTAALRDRRIGNSDLRFIRRSDVPHRAVIDHLVPTGHIKVSSPEITVLDLVEAPEHGAGLSNVATVIAQFVEDGLIDAGALAADASTYPTAVAQRAGYLIESMSELVGTAVDLSPLDELVTGSDRVALAPSLAPTEQRNDRWRVSVNIEIEPDR